MKTKGTQKNAARQQLDFWPEQCTHSMIVLSRLLSTKGTQRGGARSVSASTAALSSDRRVQIDKESPLGMYGESSFPEHKK